MISWVKTHLSEWGTCTEQMLTSSPLGYRKHSSLTALMDYGTGVRRQQPRSVTPDNTLPKRLRKNDRIIKMQPPEFQELAFQHYIEGRGIRQIARKSKCSHYKISTAVDNLHHRIDALWELVRE